MSKVFSIDGNTISYGGFMLRELGSGTLTITKTVTGSSAYDPARTFEVVVTFDKVITFKANGVTMVGSSYTANLAAQQSVVLSEIPENTSYSVTETLSPADIADGFSIDEITGASGIIVDGSYSCTVANGLTFTPNRTAQFLFSNPNYSPAEHFPRDVDEPVGTFLWTRISTSPNIWRYYRDAATWDLAFCDRGWVGDNVHFGGQDTGDITLLCANLGGADSSHYGPVVSVGSMFSSCANLVRANRIYIRSNGSGLANASNMFRNCTKLEEVTFMGTPDLGTASGMFYGCTALKAVPSLNTRLLQNTQNMFYGCVNVESGALALYNQMASQSTPPSNHQECFKDCGSNTTSGAAELAQIPTSWGGTAT